MQLYVLSILYGALFVGVSFAQESANESPGEEPTAADESVDDAIVCPVRTLRGRFSCGELRAPINIAIAGDDDNFGVC